MHCTSCAINIERSIEKINGVKKVQINFTNSTGLIIASNNINLENILSTIKKSGYEAIAEIVDEKNNFNRQLIFNYNDIDKKSIDEKSFEVKAIENEQKQIKKEKKRLIISWLLTFPIAIKMFLSMVFKIELFSLEVDLLINLLLSFIIIFIVSFDVIRATFFAFRSLSFNMDSLIGIGSIASFSTIMLKFANFKI